VTPGTVLSSPGLRGRGFGAGEAKGSPGDYFIMYKQIWVRGAKLCRVELLSTAEPASRTHTEAHARRHAHACLAAQGSAREHSQPGDGAQSPCRGSSGPAEQGDGVIGVLEGVQSSPPSSLITSSAASRLPFGVKRGASEAVEPTGCW